MSASSDPLKQIIALMQEKDENRNAQWEKHFLRLFPQTYLTLLSSQPHQGPDGMPYFLAQITEQSQEPALKLLDWLARKGIGLVIHPKKSYPDYIFTYGMIWNFKETRAFLSPHTTPVPIDKSFLPDYVRVILKQFFSDQGIWQPQLAIVQTSGQMEICFSLESLGNPPTSEHKGILKAISWFVPQHYRLALSQKGADLPFVNL